MKVTHSRVRLFLRPDVVGPRKHLGLGPQQSRSRVDLRYSSRAGLQSHKWPLADCSCPSVGPGRLPILVRPKEPGDDLVSPQLLLSLQQRGLHNEGQRQTSKIILHLPVSPRKQQIIALQKYTSLLPLSSMIVHIYSSSHLLSRKGGIPGTKLLYFHEAY